MKSCRSRSGHDAGLLGALAKWPLPEVGAGNQPIETEVS